MQLAFAVLADFAEITSEGKIAMLGGDFDTIKSPAFPSIHPRLSLVVKLNVEPAEYDKEHQLLVEVLDPQGTSILPAITSVFTPRVGPGGPDRPLKYSFVLNFHLFMLSTSGKYLFRLFVDSKEIGAIPLYAEQTPGAESYAEIRG